jgi:hypothetical protein
LEFFEDTIAHAFGRIAFIAPPIVSIGANNSTIRALLCYTWIMPCLKPPKQIEQLPSLAMKGCRAVISWDHDSQRFACSFLQEPRVQEMSAQHRFCWNDDGKPSVFHVSMLESLGKRLNEILTDLSWVNFPLNGAAMAIMAYLTCKKTRFSVRFFINHPH